MRKRPRSALIATAAVLALPAASKAAAGPFQSPSGNIGCFLDASSVRCDIAEREWAPPAKPAGCDFDYGQGLRVGKSGRGAFVCAGDTALGAGPALPFGAKRSAGRFTCTSSTSGIRCVNRRNGHGFRLSRESYKRF